jgi:hypothetical protein
LVEGHGEVEAVGNLMTRMSERASDTVRWAKPLRWPNLDVWDARGRGGVRAAIEFIRGKGDAASLLLLRDADEGCPRSLGPDMTAKIRAHAPTVPVAYVLFEPEYEVLFLPCLAAMAGRDLEGRPGLEPGTKWDGSSWEARRGVKEWLSAHYPRGKRYKETVDQLVLTRMIDLDVLAAASVPCFGTLEGSIAFFKGGRAGDVYP